MLGGIIAFRKHYRPAESIICPAGSTIGLLKALSVLLEALSAC